MKLTYGRIRPGLWALHHGAIGIINRVQGNAAEFHYVDEHGDTMRIDVIALDDLDMPTREHIPANRLADIHPEWKPGDDVRYTDDYMRRHGLHARAQATGEPAEPTGLSSLEFVDDAEFLKFTPDARARVKHVRDPETGKRHDGR